MLGVDFTFRSLFCLLLSLLHITISANREYKLGMSSDSSSSSSGDSSMQSDLLAMGFEEEAVRLAVRNTEAIGG